MNVIRLLSLTAIYCLMVAMLNGCDRDDETSTMPSNPGSSNSAVASATLGPAGGMISSSDGSLTLTIPPGALTQEETITIDVIDLSQLPPGISECAGASILRAGPGRTHLQSACSNLGAHLVPSRGRRYSHHSFTHALYQPRRCHRTTRQYSKSLRRHREPGERQRRIEPFLSRGIRGI